MTGYSDQIKQAFNVTNGTDREIYKAKYRRIMDIFGKHTLDCGN
jgi:ribosomal protein S15